MKIREMKITDATGTQKSVHIKNDDWNLASNELENVEFKLVR